MNKNYNDQQIKNLLHNYSNLKRRYTSAYFKEILQYTRVTTSKGRTLSVKQFKKKFENKLEYGIAMLEKWTQPDYVLDVVQKYKNNIVTGLNNMGREEQAKYIEEMELQEFIRLDKKGTFKDIIQKYNDANEKDIVEAVAGNTTQNKKGKNYDIVRNEIDKKFKELGWE